MFSIENPTPEVIMQKNMGTVDRTARLIFAALVLVLYVTNMISGTIAILLGLFAVIFVITSVVGFCPLYVPLKLSTMKKE
jgi:uncharacterized membrane protein